MRSSATTPIAISIVAGLAWGAVALVSHAQPQTQAPTSLAQAVRIAEQRTSGHARKVEIENERGIDVYEIKTVAKDKGACVYVEIATGRVVRVEGSGFLENVFDREDRWEEQAALARLEASSMNLAAAIEAAEKETGARAVEAWMYDQYGSMAFEVGVVKDWVKQQVLIDPATARVIPRPAEVDD
jgi:uncharacterized membrane protein YkoI